MTTPSTRLLLLSGGIDSAALGVLHQPAHALYIDYGQRPRRAERRAAVAIAGALDIPFSELAIDLGELGGGLLSDEILHPHWPSPEWWPYRNQLLVTLAASWAIKHLHQALAHPGSLIIQTGTVKSDGKRHADGTPDFYSRLGDLLNLQEGAARLEAPVIEMTTAQLVRTSGVSDAVLGWTHSCHRSDLPCGDCPGCFKREEVLDSLGRLR